MTSRKMCFWVRYRYRKVCLMSHYTGKTHTPALITQAENNRCQKPPSVASIFGKLLTLLYTGKHNTIHTDGLKQENTHLRPVTIQLLSLSAVVELMYGLFCGLCITTNPTMSIQMLPLSRVRCCCDVWCDTSDRPHLTGLYCQVRLVFN